MKRAYKVRRTIVIIATLIGFALTIGLHPDLQQAVPTSDMPSASSDLKPVGDAAKALEQLTVKGRAPKTDYARSQFGSGWEVQSGCDTRNMILYRDLTHTIVDDECRVVSGTLNDPYTGKTIQFTRGSATSQDVQIDHVVALSNAWQTGAQALTPAQRVAFANDPLELLAVDGGANQEKSDGDAATWLPANKAFRCQYVARQIAIKAKYELWVTAAEKDAMKRVLQVCPGQMLPAK